VDSEGRHHPFELLDYHGEQVAIDVEIVPLIRLCWALELDTLFSCQEDEDGLVWVEFDGPSGEAFLNLVQRWADRDTSAHMRGSVPVEIDPFEFDAYKAAHCWRYQARPMPSYSEDESRPLGLSVSVRFPRAQLPAVVSALERAKAAA
jgi:hypothetical protein